VILRCTQKLLDLLDVHAGALATAAPSEDDWYANLLWLARRKCLLLAHAGTLFAVFVPEVRKADLLLIGNAAVRLIQRELAAEGLGSESFGHLDGGTVRLAKTASRSVLGYMHEMAVFCEYAITTKGGFAGCDFDLLNRDLRRDLHLSQQTPGYFVPIELARRRTTRIVTLDARP
jgi:hypothetical protein